MIKKGAWRKEPARDKRDNAKRRRRILWIVLGLIILLAIIGFILQKEIFSNINSNDENTLGSFDKPVNPEQNGRPTSDDSSVNDAQGLSSENEEDQPSDSRPATRVGGGGGGSGGSSGSTGDNLPENDLVCGNSVRENAEQCDGIDLDDNSCQTQGYDDGDLKCNADCSFNFSLCTTCGNSLCEQGENETSCSEDCAVPPVPICGDGIKNESEECDGLNLGENSCSSLGYDGGSLSCNESCMFDHSLCYECGNGVIEDVEICDDNNINANDGCNSTCQIESGWECSGEPSSCTLVSPFCTNCAANQVCIEGVCLNASCTSEGYFCSVGSEYSVRYPAGDVDCSPPDTYCFVTQCTLSGGICTPSYCNEASIPGGEYSCQEQLNGKDYCCNATETCIAGPKGMLFCDNSGCPLGEYYWPGYAWCYGQGYEFCCAMQEPLSAPEQRTVRTLVDLIKELLSRFSF